MTRSTRRQTILARYTVEQFASAPAVAQCWAVVLTTDDRQEALLHAGLLATTTPTRSHRVMSPEGCEAFHMRSA